MGCRGAQRSAHSQAPSLLAAARKPRSGGRTCDETRMAAPCSGSCRCSHACQAQLLSQLQSSVQPGFPPHDCDTSTRHGAPQYRLAQPRSTADTVRTAVQAQACARDGSNGAAAPGGASSATAAAAPRTAVADTAAPAQPHPSSDNNAPSHDAQQSQQQPQQHAAQTMSLEDVRSNLIRQEDTIIFNIIERAEFARNAGIYQPGGVAVPAYAPDGTNFSFLEYLLRESEAVHGRVRRYTVPDERAFFPHSLPPTVLPPRRVESMLHPRAGRLNINAAILDVYLSEILPGFTADRDDGHYGSSAMYDVLLLQALSKRIHWGAFVAEAKFSAEGDQYAAAIRAQDADALLAMLTFPEQEANVVARVQAKAATFGQDVDAAGTPRGTRYKVEPEVIAALYRDWVMPLTKKVQVQYLLRRLD